MLIKMLRHGTGSAARAASYVLDEKDHMNIVRPHVEVLCGDPHLFAKIADSSPFKHKYTSAVIAFAEEDQPTDVEIKDVLKQFEALAFSGLEPDQYHMTAVLHQEPNGSKHIHILVPRLELRSGRSMNIAPPGKFQKHFHTLQDKLNFEYGWADPNDPDRARFTKNGHETYLQSALKKVGKNRENYKQYIENTYLQLLSISLKQLEKKHTQVIPSELLVRNRDDFMQFVLNNKLASDVVKIREKQFSLVPPFGKKPIYFQGEIYERHFNIEKCSRTIRERIKSLEQVRTADREGGNDEQRTVNQISEYTRTPCAQLRDRAEQALQGARQARADYNRQRYASATTSEKRDTDFNQRVEIISRRAEAEYQQYSNDAVIASQRNRSDHAKASSAEQSPITTDDQRQSEFDQSPNSEQHPKHYAVIRRSEETVAAASKSGINSVDHSQPEINSENIYSDGAWNVAAEYFSNITRQLLSHTADFNQKPDRNFDGRQGQSFPSNYLLEMDRLQYSEFEQKEGTSDGTEYSSDISMHCGEISHERTEIYDYSTPQRQRHTADDFGFTRTNEFSFDAIIAEYYPEANINCYSDIGAVGARTSSLEMGVRQNKNDYSPAESITNMVHDKLNLFAGDVGHRLWMLNPFLKKSAYGSVNAPSFKDTRFPYVVGTSYKVVYPFDNPTTAPLGVIAYPYHNYPAKYYMAGSILSISVLTDQKNFFANRNVDYAKANVVVTERSSGAKQKISNIRYENIGVPNHIQFNFDDLKLNVIYDVKLSNVLVNGQPKEYSYWFKVDNK